MDKRTCKQWAYDVAAGVLQDHVEAGCVYESIGHRIDVTEDDAHRIASALEVIAKSLSRYGPPQDPK